MDNCIYKLTSPSGKVYIGQAKNYSSRIRQHIVLSKKSDTLISRAIRKYGIDKFEVKFLYQQDQYNRPDLDKKEIFFIEKYKSTDKNLGYNICKGGEGRTGPLSKSTRKKMSEAKKGKPSNRKNTTTSEETRKQMRESHSKPHSEYQTRRISEGLSIPIEQYTLDGIYVRSWSSIKKAVSETKIKTIGDSLRGRQKTAGSFIWKYEDKEYKPSSKKRKLQK